MIAAKNALAALSLALTGKPSQMITDHQLAQVVEGKEFYPSDDGYSRVIVSITTGKAFLTSNRPEVVAVWPQCLALISDVERFIHDLRIPLGWEANTEHTDAT
jgi:hypothetical protein